MSGSMTTEKIRLKAASAPARGDRTPSPVEREATGHFIESSAAVGRGSRVHEWTPRRVEGKAEAQRRGALPPIGMISFLLIVLIPFACMLYYYTFSATDQFISETRFAVRSFGDTAGNSYHDADGSGVTSGQSVLRLKPLQQDSYLVTSFIHSPAILDRLSQKIDLRALFGNPSVDWLSRLRENASPEDLMTYWNDQVSTYVDGPSGIVTMYVRAFSPQSAHQIGELVITESEQLVNELAERSRRDVVARATAEVEQRGTEYRKTLTDLNLYQNSSGILSPQDRASETGTLLTALMAQKLSIDSRLFVLRQSVDDNAPTVKQLQNAHSSLDKQIAELRGQLAAEGSVDQNLSNALNKFSTLETERVVAEGLFEAARRNLESARAEAARKSVYLTVFVDPTVPVESRFPRRVEFPILLLLGLFVVWAIVMLAWASIEDHRL